ncbi:MAG: hypothetical protein JXQ82_04155 [Methanomicrobiaceae archaeon]|nr:hypothetical protein [Methanomicrobiaceae archaeon]
MPRCIEYEQCPFIKKYEPAFKKSEILKKRSLIYCDGNLSEECMRKKISKALGGTVYVPINMMPEGKPVPGTHNTEWTAEVLSLLEKYK